MKKTPNGFEVIGVFEQFSPKKLAMEGDKIGLQIGTLNKPVAKVMIALDVLDEVVDEAIERQVDLIIAHHPIIYRPLQKIATDQPSGKLVEKLIKHDIAVYAAHTNLDVTKGGVNDLLAEALQLQNTKVLAPTYETKLRKLAVFVPVEAEAKVREALGNAGAGHIGNYSHCSFASPGSGQFLPGSDTNPHIGSVGELETVQEVKIETVFPEELERRVVTAMIKAHPYEEVAYDIYSLENGGESLGLGRIGELPSEMTLESFAHYVKEAFDVKGVRVVGNLQDTVKKVAVLGGDGNKYFMTAKFQGADVYVTGDMYYHTAHDAMSVGLNIVDPGHNVEKVMKAGVTNVLTSYAKAKSWEIDVFASVVHTDPFTFL
ncbi:Nif3-like dinuclear metal center hexameric protein [Bacillus massiliigorillae]|uniref:Nif3-like dinuclear metal center hexameric protein n=1 Tax=Bacillus massiliigorillae TaxID=1243664 RepID=UPI0003A6B049|nr:Nif3-like dinuclear metal center hexameric protein [Bacillus massiliigorillae]